MADEADLAKELEELALQQALASRKSGPRLVPAGYCHNCREKLEPVTQNGELKHLQLFCDLHCSEDWEQRERVRISRT
jgi:hypothetical protein